MTFKGKIAIPLIGIASAFHFFDLIKDSLIFIEIIFSQGGLGQIMIQPKPYIRWILYTILTSIVVPFLLGSIQFLMEGSKAMFGQFSPDELLKKLAMYLAIPFYPLYLIMWEKTLKEASKVYIIPTNVLEEAKYYAYQLIQVDIGLESNFQLIISTTLLLLANSQTNTITGLEVLF